MPQGKPTMNPANPKSIQELPHHLYQISFEHSPDILSQAMRIASEHSIEIFKNPQAKPAFGQLAYLVQFQYTIDMLDQGNGVADHFASEVYAIHPLQNSFPVVLPEGAKVKFQVVARGIDGTISSTSAMEFIAQGQSQPCPPGRLVISSAAPYSIQPQPPQESRGFVPLTIKQTEEAAGETIPASYGDIPKVQNG